MVRWLNWIGAIGLRVIMLGEVNSVPLRIIIDFLKLA